MESEFKKYEVLYDLVENNNLSKIKSLVGYSFTNYNYNNIRLYNKAIRSAAKNGSLSIVRYLIGYEIKKNIFVNQCELLFQIIVIAAMHGHLNIVKYLIEKNVSFKERDDALGQAAKFGYFDIVQYLFENNANIQADNNYALRNASSNGHLKIVKFLVENGADVDDDYHDAINLAAEYSHLHVVTYLLNLYENDDNLIYLLNDIYGLKLDFNQNLINKINILIWSIKLNNYNYFKVNFNQESLIYEFIFNNDIGYYFEEYMENNEYLKNKYIKLETICQY